MSHVLGVCVRRTGRVTALRRKRLNETLAHMRERISGKLGNRNDSAFKLRKLFAMYDTQRTGKVCWCFVCREWGLATQNLTCAL